MAEFAALPLFTDSLTADCTHLSDEEFGRYMRLLIVMWRSPNCRIPNDPTWICKRLRLDPLQYVGKVKPIIDEFCICIADALHGDFIMQKRLSKEYEHVRGSVEKRKAAAKKRWDTEKQQKSGVQCMSNAYAPTPTPTPTVLDKDKPLSKGYSDPVRPPNPMEIDMHFQNVWAAYPSIGKDGMLSASFKGSRKTAKEKFETIYKNTKEENRGQLVKTIIAACGGYTQFLERAGYPCKHLSTWLNARGWEDEYGAVTGGASATGQRSGNPSITEVVTASIGRFSDDGRGL